MHYSFKELKEYNTNPNNPEIKSHLENCDICRNVLEGIQLIDELSEIEGISSEDFISRSKVSVKTKIDSRPNNKKWVRVFTAAASLTVLLLASLYFAVFSPEKAHQESILSNVKYDYYRSPDMLRASSKDNAWGQFNLLYSNNKFVSAVQYLPNDDQPITIFYEGLCYFYMNEPQWNKAIDSFKTLSNSNNRFTDQASWYLAVCYYEINQKANALDLWEKISSNDQHYKQSEAKILLKELSP